MRGVPSGFIAGPPLGRRVGFPATPPRIPLFLQRFRLLNELIRYALGTS